MNHEDNEGKTEQSKTESTEIARRTTIQTVGLGVVALLTGGAVSGAAQAQGEMETLQGKNQVKGAMTHPSAAGYISSNNVNDLREVRLPGLAKPFEELTISELTQLRPGGNAADSYSIEAVGSDISISTSSILSNLARARGDAAVRAEAPRLAPGAGVEIKNK